MARPTASCTGLAAALLLVARAATADESPPIKGPLFHPDGPGALALRVGVGARLDVLPSRLVESETRTIPELTANARLGLPAGFSVDAALAAIVITNELSLGAGWSVRVGDVSLRVHDRIAFWYGVLGVQGFDARGWGFFDYPGATVGLPWKETRFALTAEAIVGLSQHVALGDSPTLSRTKTSVLGSQATLVVENLLEGGGEWYFGAGVVNALPQYEAWVAFSDARARLPYPRFLGGYAF
jgi:hypothetical protein